jgi:hypothetical protein
MPSHPANSGVMMTDFGSAKDPREVAPRLGDGDIMLVGEKGERRKHGDPFWSWIRVVMYLLVACILGFVGYQLRPTTEKPISVFEPTIRILADKPDATATVGMALSSDPGQQTPYSLTLTIKPVSPSQGVTFAVSFDSFPPAASGTGLLHGPTNAQYALIGSTLGLSGTVALSKPFTYASLQPIGENNAGAQLRVAFPDLMGENPGGAPVQGCSVAGSLASAFNTICGQLSKQFTWFPPSLDAGTTTFESANPALQNYQYLAGDNPVLLYGGDQWMWSGINGVQLLAASVQAQANDQNDVFESGVLLGLAGGAAIAFIGELLRPAWKKEPEKAKTGT